MNRQKKLLSILLGLFGVALTYGIATYPRRERVESGPPQAVTAPRQTTVRAARPISPEAARLPLEESPEDVAAGEVKRNIFEPLFPVEAPPVPARPSPGQEGAPEQPREILPPPPPPFELLGYLKKNQEQIIFLTRANELFIVKPEESFGEDNRYRIVEAGSERVVLEEKDTRERTSLFFAEDGSGIEPGGQPFSGIDPRYQGPPAEEDLPMPEPPADFEPVPEEPEGPPEDYTGEQENSPEEAAPRSPLSPGLIGPEDSDGDANFFEEDAAPSRDEVPDE